MKSYRIFAGLLAAMAGAGLGAVPARAQMSSDPAIAVRQVPGKKVWLRGEVVRADRETIMVRDENNLTSVHTFTYAPGLKDKMGRVFDQGGFQNGDHVMIRYVAGETVALDIRGRPSRPI
jgi:hypothetical protein